MQFERLLFGTAGVPNSTPKKNSPVDGVKQIHALGLDCMQLEFAHGVRMKDEISSGLRKISFLEDDLASGRDLRHAVVQGLRRRDVAEREEHR